jgi:ATP-dependent RNA helicase RhlE
MAIHGNKSQNARVRALEDFKENRITALVATEVAARGLDIKELPHVVNYELPNVPEDYVHRIGRTARAGSTGAAVSLVSPDELPLLKDIEKLLKRAVEFAPTPKFEIKEGTHTPREGAETGEYQPHQDPRRRPEHRRPRGQNRGGNGGRQGGGRGHAPRVAAGQVAHEAYTPDFVAADAGAPAADRPHHGGRNEHRGGGQRGQGRGGQHRGGQAQQGQGGQQGQRGESRGGQHQGRNHGSQGHGGRGGSHGQGGGNRDGQRSDRGRGGGGQRGRGGFVRGARSSGGQGGQSGSGGGFSRMK